MERYDYSVDNGMMEHPIGAYVTYEDAQAEIAKLSPKKYRVMLTSTGDGSYTPSKEVIEMTADQILEMIGKGLEEYIVARPERRQLSHAGVCDFVVEHYNSYRE